MGLELSLVQCHEHILGTLQSLQNSWGSGAVCGTWTGVTSAGAGSGWASGTPSSLLIPAAAGATATGRAALLSELPGAGLGSCITWPLKFGGGASARLMLAAGVMGVSGTCCCLQEPLATVWSRNSSTTSL